MNAYTHSGIPFSISDDDTPAPGCQIGDCTDLSDGSCIVCESEICERHTRWAEGQGQACPGCVVEMIDDGDVIYLTHADAEERLVAA